MLWLGISVLFVNKPKFSLDKCGAESVFKTVNLSLCSISSTKTRFIHLLDLVALLFFSNTGDGGITSGLDRGLEKDLELGVVFGPFSLHSMIFSVDPGGMRENREVIFICLEIPGWL